MSLECSRCERDIRGGCDCHAGSPLAGPGVLHEIGCTPTAIERDLARIRAELRDRLDRCTDADRGAAFGWLADNHPDLVREALDETGAPS